MFIDPQSTLTAPQALDDIFPFLTPATRSGLLSFYPPPSDSTPYTTEIARFAAIYSDGVFNYNRYALSTALPDRTYNLLTAGDHGTGCTLVFGGVVDSNQPVYSEAIVNGMRRFVMNFIVTGNPNEAGGGGVSSGVEWPVYGATGQGLSIDGQTMEVADMTAMNSVWEWWVKGLIFS